jgi:hypothetical protein
MADRTKLVTTPDPIIGLFNDRERAEHAYQELVNNGYSQDEITVVVTEFSFMARDSRGARLWPGACEAVDRDASWRDQSGQPG